MLVKEELARFSCLARLNLKQRKQLGNMRRGKLFDHFLNFDKAPYKIAVKETNLRRKSSYKFSSMYVAVVESHEYLFR